MYVIRNHRVKVVCMSGIFELQPGTKGWWVSEELSQAPAVSYDSLKDVKISQGAAQFPFVMNVSW